MLCGVENLSEKNLMKKSSMIDYSKLRRKNFTKPTVVFTSQLLTLRIDTWSKLSSFWIAWIFGKQNLLQETKIGLQAMKKKTILIRYITLQKLDNHYV